MSGVEGAEREDFDDSEAGVVFRASASTRPEFITTEGHGVHGVRLESQGAKGEDLWCGRTRLFAAWFDRLRGVCKIERLVLLIRRL
jgi:hypothetical protein